MSKSIFMNDDDDDDYDFLDSSSNREPILPAKKTSSFFHDDDDDDDLDEVFTPRETALVRPESKVFAAPREKQIRPPRREPQPIEYEETYGETYEDDYEEESPKPREKNRLGLVLVRWLVIGGLLGLVIIGAWNVISPPNIPSPEQVVSRVKYDLGVTNFPVQRGEAFALAFLDTHLSSGDAGQKASDTQLFLGREAPRESGVVFDSNINVSVSAGPYVSNTKEVNDNLAMISAIARLSTGVWVNLTVPVFYNNNSDAFTVLELPTLTPFPALSGVPDRGKIGTVNAELSESAMRALAEFFSAWGTNDVERLELFISANDPHQRVKNGLNTPGISFVDLKKIEVYNHESGTTTPRDYIATATVEWENIYLQPLAENADPIYNDRGELIKEIEVKTRFISNYQLIVTLGADNKWSVKDILPEEFLLRYEE